MKSEKVGNQKKIGNLKKQYVGEIENLKKNVIGKYWKTHKEGNQQSRKSKK